MNLEVIKSVITSRAARQVLLTKKHSPAILFVAGTVGVVASTVLACRATLKMDDVLDTHEKTKSELDILYSEMSPLESDDQREQNATKALHKLQIKTALDIAKLYAPAVGLGVLSIGALTGAQVVLTKRNTAIMAAYAGLDRAFKEYRNRVSDEYGKDVDRKFSMGAEEIEVQEKLDNGKTKLTSETVKKKDGRYGGSPYAVVFDERSQHFTREPGMNASIIMMKMNWANDKLRAKGHLFLNEVYDFLDLPRTKAGSVVGWVYDPKNDDHKGDNFVSFGVFDGDAEWVEAFIDGKEKYAVLDFNVDGMIYDKI